MPADASDQGTLMQDVDEDWLQSDEDASSSKGDYAMASKDTSKIQAKMYDEGYRTGIEIGKEAKIQLGFDQGYNEQGAAIGQKYGHLLGTITGMEQYISRSGSKSAPFLEQVRALKVTVKALQISDLVEPDWEALEHERQHDNASVSQRQRETQEQKKKRESLLDDLQATADELMQKVLGQAK